MQYYIYALFGMQLFYYFFIVNRCNKLIDKSEKLFDITMAKLNKEDVPKSLYDNNK